jgi:2-polyprenyl-6-methoxyphenol hydroxylase-like FAD-dependent oxidoreductase
MERHRYDAIVVGARCAGSPTAMLLARKGHKVLVVDRVTFPSDTISTHLIHPPGVGLLRSWGLLDRVIATNCPAIDTYMFDFGPIVLTGSPACEASAVSYGPRRTVLDKLLVDAAAEAGAEIREAFTVDELMVDDGHVTGIRGHERGGKPVAESAQVVIGADGRHSSVAAQLKPEQYNEKPELLASYYSYFSGLPMHGRFEAYTLPYCSFAVWPTNDDLTLVIVGWPYAQFEANKHDVEGNFHRVIDMAPEFSKRLRAAKREERFAGAAVPNYFRKPFGPGWALVGDAGYNRDFITAQGIQDAFRDAQTCADALDSVFTEGRSYADAMTDYQTARDNRVAAIYELTAGLASQEPPSPQMQQIFAAMRGNQEAMDGFARVIAGVTPPPEFFSEENIGRIFAAAKETPRDDTPGREARPG